MSETSSVPTLYYDIRSPPARSCLMLLETISAKSVILKEIDIFKGEQRSPHILDLNPLGTVPFLKDGDLVLTDSHAILIHLCEKCPTSKTDSEESLWPSNNYADRMKVLNRLLFEGTLFFRRDSDVMSEIIRKGYDNVDISYHRRKIHEAYQMMELFLRKSKFIALDYMTIADFSVVTTLSTTSLLFPVTSDKWPLLYRWFQSMKLLPCYKTNLDGLEKLQIELEAFGKFKISSQN